MALTGPVPMRGGILGSVLTVAGLLAGAAQAQDVKVQVTYLRVEEPPAVVLSNLDPIPEDRGIAGAQLGLADNATTGQFMGHAYALDVVSLPPGSDAAAEAARLGESGQLVLTDMGLGDQLSVADLPGLAQALIFNVSAEDGVLRNRQCRANLLHTASELRMRTDALMQVLLAKRWTKAALIEGESPENAALAEAYRASARKFGIKIVSTAAWSEAGDLRRNAAQEVPLLTQKFKDHHVVLVADAADDFARYIEHNTWVPRPVIGSTGLRALTWDRVVEQWGAAQLQSRFQALAGRDMGPRDFAAWVAMRVIGEAVTRTGSADPQMIRDYVRSAEVELAAFRGRPVSFRTWNGQLRQPIPVVNARAVVGVAPLDGFEHARNPLDSLGTDAPESTCTEFETALKKGN